MWKFSRSGVCGKVKWFTVNQLTSFLCRWTKLVCPSVMHSVAPSKCYLTTTTGAVARQEETREPVFVADRSGWGKFCSPLKSLSCCNSPRHWALLCGGCSVHVCGLCLNLCAFPTYTILHVCVCVCAQGRYSCLSACIFTHRHAGYYQILKGSCFFPSFSITPPLSMNEGFVWFFLRLSALHFYSGFALHFLAWTNGWFFFFFTLDLQRKWFLTGRDGGGMTN